MTVPSVSAAHTCSGVARMASWMRWVVVAAGRRCVPVVVRWLVSVLMSVSSSGVPRRLSPR